MRSACARARRASAERDARARSANARAQSASARARSAYAHARSASARARSANARARSAKRVRGARAWRARAVSAASGPAGRGRPFGRGRAWCLSQRRAAWQVRVCVCGARLVRLSKSASYAMPHGGRSPEGASKLADGATHTGYVRHSASNARFYSAYFLLACVIHQVMLDFTRHTFG